MVKISFLKSGVWRTGVVAKKKKQKWKRTNKQIKKTPNIQKSDICFLMPMQPNNMGLNTASKLNSLLKKLSNIFCMSIGEPVNSNESGENIWIKNSSPAKLRTEIYFI